MCPSPAGRKNIKAAMLAASIFAIMPIQTVFAAQWQEYRDSERGFSASFPGIPKVIDTPYRLLDGTTVPAQILSLNSDNNEYRLVVVDFSGSTLDDEKAVDGAIDGLRAMGQVSVDIAARVRRNYGRQLAVTGTNGRHCVAAIFLVNRRLFEIEGFTPTAGVNTDSSGIVRFQQSLDFF
jgi:hypothetical protein